MRMTSTSASSVRTRYTLNNIGSLKSIITMQPQEKSARVLLGLHGNSTEGFLLKNLFCLECMWYIHSLEHFARGPLLFYLPIRDHSEACSGHPTDTADYGGSGKTVEAVLCDRNGKSSCFFDAGHGGSYTNC